MGEKMNYRKGFTLVEVLGVIALVGVILTFTIPTMIGVIDRSKEKAYNVQAENILKAAKDYVLENSATNQDLKQVGIVVDVSLETLSQAGSIDLPIKNAITGQYFDATKIIVKIRREQNGLYSYCFYDSDHEDHLCGDFTNQA